MIVASKTEELGFAAGRPVVATIGNFDGVHLGHQAIMARVVERARALDGLAAAVTFDPHPRRLLDPEHAPRTMFTRFQKLAALQRAGLDAVCVLPFDRRLAAMPAEEFAREILARRLGVREIHVGRDFRFGRGRAGDVPLLNKLGAALGFTAHEVPPVMHDDERISTSRIRESVGAGRVEEAAQMLGRPFALAGTIVHGEGRGGAVLVPTANLAPENELLPARGVYFTLTRLGDLHVPGLTNIGVRPTFGDHRLVVETFLPGFKGDLYGARVELDFQSRHRDERKFDSPEGLLAQIQRDIDAFEEWRGKRG